MSSNSIRSASTASSIPSKLDSGVKKYFTCTWPACGKSFSRSEHLHRHALNHKEGDNTCLRCAAHFRRRDLLDRHMIRHKEKDDEAGGEGLGHLATRKRLWRDADGKIVNARRPYKSNGVKRRQLSPERVSQGAANHDQQQEDTGTQVEAPPSPPTSVPSSTGQTSNERFGHNDLVQDPWSIMDPALISTQHEESRDPLDFLCNASWGSEPFQNYIGTTSPDLPYDDIFKPDTAMSFNAPFTTMGYYSWLFENDCTRAGESVAVDPHLLTQPRRSEDNQTSFLLESMRMDLNSIMPDEQSQYTSTSMTGSQGIIRFGNISAQPSYQTMATQVMIPDGRLDYLYASNSGDHPATCSPDFDSSAIQSMQPCISQQNPLHKTSPTSQISTPATRRSISLDNHNLPDAYVSHCMEKLPTITHRARDGLMKIIKQTRPTKPDGSEVILSDPLLSLSSLQHYSDLFFTRFNTSYPLIHQATFQAGQVHAFLLMAILLLGATYSDKEAHLLAVCIHDIMRPLIHASKEFGTRPKLWMLQTILLVECFGKSRAGERQHDFSHLYHGMLINLIRRSDCQSACLPQFHEQTHDLEEYWRLSVEAEQKRRLAMLCFMWDTQHAVLFSQSLCMNASELKLTLPWDPNIWEAPTATEWHQLIQNAPSSPQYLSILKMYTNLSNSSPPPQLNALSRVLILHGLMSISWDLCRRDQTSLSLSVTNSTVSWPMRLSNCYTVWKHDFDQYTQSVLSSLSFSSTNYAKFQRFTIANLAVYHTAQLVLEVDIIDLQIHAGARHIIGRPVTDSDRARSQARIAEWIARDEGTKTGKAAYHAARLFRDGARKLENWNVDEMFHYPWCLYLATLMCWAFHGAASQNNTLYPMVPHNSGITCPSSSSPSAASLTDAKGSTSSQSNAAEDEDSDWDSVAEMNALISALTRLDPSKDSFRSEVWDVGAKYRTQGLVRCMVKQLNTIRWAVVREGMVVLKSLR